MYDLTDRALQQLIYVNLLPGQATRIPSPIKHGVFSLNWNLSSPSAGKDGGDDPLPLPKNHKVYTKTEAAFVLLSTKKGSPLLLQQ